MRIRIFSQGGPSGDRIQFDVAVDTMVDQLFIAEGATDGETSFLEPLQEIPATIASGGVSYAWHPGTLYVFVHGRRYQVSIRDRTVVSSGRDHGGRDPGPSRVAVVRHLPPAPTDDVEGDAPGFKARTSHHRASPVEVRLGSTYRRRT